MSWVPASKGFYVSVFYRYLFPANMPIWVPYGLPIWGVQPGLAWVPYGLAHMWVAQMGPIWVPYNSPIKKKEMI